MKIILLVMAVGLLGCVPPGAGEEIVNQRCAAEQAAVIAKYGQPITIEYYGSSGMADWGYKTDTENKHIRHVVFVSRDFKCQVI